MMTTKSLCERKKEEREKRRRTSFWSWLSWDKMKSYGHFRNKKLFSVCTFFFIDPKYLLIIWAEIIISLRKKREEDFRQMSIDVPRRTSRNILLFSICCCQQETYTSLPRSFPLSPFSPFSLFSIETHSIYNGKSIFLYQYWRICIFNQSHNGNGFFWESKSSFSFFRHFFHLISSRLLSLSINLMKGICWR